MLRVRRSRGGHKSKLGLAQTSRVLETCLEEPATEGNDRGCTKSSATVEWMLQEFKTKPCNQEICQGGGNHNKRCCPFYHGIRDRRRPVFASATELTALYRAEPCADQFDDERSCGRGDNCAFSHSTTELLYHPDLFRKRLCHQSQKCPRMKFCAFAHTRCELLVPQFSEATESQPSQDFILYEFKTQWCPVGGPHDWENCVYAHTYRDWRRTPRLGYSSRPCQQWSQSVASGATKLAYSDRCPRGFACPYAHGAKEQLYHPHFYKTSPCSDKRCQRGTLCAFTHENKDVRVGARADHVRKHVKEPLRHADVLLHVYQPGHGNPPKYALEETPAPSKAASKTARREAAFAEAQAQQAHLPEWLREPSADDPYLAGCAAMAALQYPSMEFWLGADQQWPQGTTLTLPSYISSVARKHLSSRRSEELLGNGLAQAPRQVQELSRATQLVASADLAAASAASLEDWSWLSAAAWQPMVLTVPVFAPIAAAAQPSSSTPSDSKAKPDEWQYGAAAQPAMSVLQPACAAQPAAVLAEVGGSAAEDPPSKAEKRQTPKDLEDLLRSGLAQGIEASCLGSPAESGTTTSVPSPRHEEEVGSSSQAASSDPGDVEAAPEAWVPEPVFAM